VAFGKSKPDPVYLIQNPPGWSEWLLELIFRRFKNPESVLIVVLDRTLPPGLRASIFHYADGLLLGPGADLSGEWQGPDVLRYAAAADLPGILPEFIERCKTLKKRTLLWIDPNVMKQSPAMKALVSSIDKFVVGDGWRLKLWCQKTSLDASQAKVSGMSQGWPPKLAVLYFPFQIAIRQFLWFLWKGDRPASLVHASTPGFWKADITTVHFLNGPFCAVIWKHFLGFATVPRLLIGLVGAVNEYVYYRLGRPRVLLTVGNSVAAALGELAGHSACIEVIPSCYDDLEFNLARRAACRVPMRAQLGISPDWFVLAFASQGDYQRKGFLKLAAAMDQLWDDGKHHFRVLLLGGNPAGIARLKTMLDDTSKHWKSWLIITGWVESLSSAMAAADAFVFPSYYESFAAVEAEACALGLPMALSDHWGSEMVLKPGQNGILLPLDAQGMAEKLLELEALIPSLIPLRPLATPLSEFPSRMGEIYRRLLPGKESLPL